MRNGVGSTGSAPPVNMTSTACLLSQPAIGRIVRSVSFGVVMILYREPVDPGHCAWGRSAHPSCEVPQLPPGGQEPVNAPVNAAPQLAEACNQDPPPSPHCGKPGATCLHPSPIGAFLTVGVHAIVPIEPSEFAVCPAAEVS